MTNFIAHLDEITDQWLSDTLGEPVQIVDRRANSAFNSAIVYLTIQRDSATIPERLIVKLNDQGAGEFEIKFYQLMAAQPMPLAMLPRTIACAYDNGRSYIVQEDLSATHVTSVTRDDVLAGRGMPSEDHLQQMTEVIARLHGYWWEHPDLQNGPIPIRPWYCNEAEFRAHVQRREREWVAFTAKVDDFPNDLHQFYTTLLARLPHLWERYLKDRITTFRHLTLSNGDCYFAQFLCPNAGAANQRAYIVDFQEASVNYGAFDLVFMFAIFWTPEQRHDTNRENRLLRRYHEILVEQGITGYTWDQLQQDYRLMLTLIVFFPIFDAVSGASHDYWWPKMQTLVANFHDLDCWVLVAN